MVLHENQVYEDFENPAKSNISSSSAHDIVPDPTPLQFTTNSDEVQGEAPEAEQHDE